MGKRNKMNPAEEAFQKQFTGTYQTGFTETPKTSSNGLIALLLVLTIFLGGLASGLGLLNIRLLKQLQATQPTVPLDVNNTPGTSASSSPLQPSPDGIQPTLPAVRDVRLHRADPPFRGNDQSLTPQEIFDRNANALLPIYCTNNHSTSSGMGIVFSSEGYILTNTHLVSTAERIYVNLPDGRQQLATLVGCDYLTDLAVLYVDVQNLQSAEFGKDEYLLEGDTLASTSSFLRQNYLFSCNLTHTRQVDVGLHNIPMLQTTVASCDGPVFNSFGQIVGLNVGGVCPMYDLALQTGTGYAIPSATIEQVVEALITYGHVPGRPSLGIQTEGISKIYQQYWNLPSGLRLLSVSQQAQDQGLQKGDILLSLDGQRVNDNNQLYSLLFDLHVGQQVECVIFRDGQTIPLSMTVIDMVV